MPPVSPSPVTSSLSARLPFPTGAGQAALATQPSQDDGYKDECLGDDFLSTHWLPPSHERAERYRKANIFQGGKAPVLSKLLPRCGKRGSSGAAAAASDPDGEVGAAEAGEVNGDGCDAQGQPPEGQAAEESGQEPVDVDLAQLGVGAELHFDLLKAFLRGFAVLLLLNIPALLLYRSGARLAKENADLLGSYVFTLGNIGQERNVLNGTALSTTFPLRAPVLNLELELSHKEAKTLLASMEVATCLVLAFLAVSVSNRITQAKQRHRRRVLTTKDFAVYVTNLPTDVTKAEIIEHFSELYPLDRPDWKGRAPPAHSGRPKLPVQDLAHVGGDQRYEGKWVADVVLARRNGRILRTALEHKDKALEIRRLRAQMKRYGPATAPAGKVDPARFARYRRQLQALEDRMRRVAQQLERDPRVAEAEQECVGAFVTFEYPESAQRCLDDYNSMNLLHLCCCFPHRLLFNGRDRLKIRPAPAPDDVMVRCKWIVGELVGRCLK